MVKAIMVAIGAILWAASAMAQELGWVQIEARPQRAQRRRGVEGARAHLHVVGLEDRAALGSPVGLQAQDDLLEAPWCLDGLAHACSPERARSQ